MASYKHIFITGNVSSEKYRAPSGMGGKPRIPVRDRVSQSQKLLSQFDAIWQVKTQLQQQRSAEQIATREGTYISFTSAADHDLITESLESTKGKKPEKWIRLLNIRTVTNEVGQKQTQAVVYIPNGKEGHFIKKLQDYQSENFRTDSISLPYLQATWKRTNDYNRTYKKSGIKSSADPEVLGWLIKHWFSPSIFW